MAWKWMGVWTAICMFVGCSPQKPIMTSEVLGKAQRILYVGVNARGGTGTTSNPFSSVQAAVDAAHPGDVVYLLPGTYTENARLKSHVSLVGSDPQTTILTANSGNILSAIGVSDIVIERLGFDGQYNADRAVFCDWKNSPGGKPLVLRGCVIRRTKSDAVMGHYLRIIIEHNVISDCVGNGILLDPANSIIRFNEISRVLSGVRLHDWDTLIHGNLIHDCMGDGMLLHNLAKSMVRENHIKNARGNGIVCEAEDLSVGLIANEISYSGRAGVRCRDRGKVILRGNHLHHNNDGGIWIESTGIVDAGNAGDLGLNSIYENGSADVTNETPYPFSAVGNWWGDKTPDSTRLKGVVDCSRPLAESRHVTPQL